MTSSQAATPNAATRSYPAYRRTGFHLLRQVPRHWKLKKLKYLASLQFSNVDKHVNDDEFPVDLCNYVDVYYNDRITKGIDFLKATATPAEVRRFRLQRGDVLITKDSEDADDIAVPALVDAELQGVLCGYHLAQIRPKSGKACGEYLFRAFAAHGIRDQFRMAATGITRHGLSKMSISNAHFPLPPLGEQRAIAAFLDRETAKIDALVARKQRLIELLKEKRAATISHAVTRGLDPNAPTKSSGIPWLGRVPKHWSLLQLRRVVSRFIDYRGRTPTKTDNGVPLITAGAVKDGAIDHSLAPEYIAEEDYEGWMSRGRPARGDVVITTEAPLAEVAQVRDEHVAFAQRVILFKLLRHMMEPDFLRHYYLSGSGKAELLSRASGSTASGIRADRLKMSLVLAPPLHEQRSISDYLSRQEMTLMAPIEHAQTAIDRLREYRTALISAAVTGKTDVRGEA